jgi:hypothetical protein
MKPTENTFFFPFNRLRAQAPHPIEKVELLESLEKPENPHCGLFDLFDLFDRGVRAGETGGPPGRGSFRAFPHAALRDPGFAPVLFDVGGMHT